MTKENQNLNQNIKSSNKTHVQQKRKLIFGYDKNIFFLALVSFLMNFTSAIVASTIIPYNKANKRNAVGGGENEFLTIVRNLFEAMSHLTKVVIGYISDYFANRKVFLLIGYGTMPIVKTLFRVSLEPVFKEKSSLIYAVGQFLDRNCDSMRDGARDTMICDSSDEKKRASAVILRKTLACLGSFLGGIFSFFYIKKYSDDSLIPSLSLLKSLYGLPLVVSSIFPVLILFFFVQDIFRENHKFEQKTKEQKQKKQTVEDKINYWFAQIFKVIGIFLFFIVSSNLYIMWNNPSEWRGFAYQMIILSGVSTIFFVSFAVYNLIFKKDIEEDTYLYELKKSIPEMRTYFILMFIVFLTGLAKLSDAFIWTAAVESGTITVKQTPLMFAIYYLFIGFASLSSVIFLRTQGFAVLIASFSALTLFNLLTAFSNQAPIWHFFFRLMLYAFYISIAQSSITAIVSKCIKNKKLYATYIGVIGLMNGFSGIANTFVALNAPKIGKYLNVAFSKVHFYQYNLSNFFNISNTIYFLAVFPCICALFICFLYKDRLQLELKK